MEFMCELPNAAYDFVWLINAHEFGPELGIIWSEKITELSLSLVSTQESRITMLCLASFLGTSPLMSAEVTVNPEILARHKI